ncbi:hypothetical protein FA10DRAFT_263418 [Acaromyces ingoldii]|uniref:CR-type domain-containing protein n=1 Tax=Acaromyces ingoldii TaxID=215250 RepID=A0A316YTV8_9BASI|nr:hypothetical protein FA10DRAFT_263418 [Acaromyces ingoldii]PWN92651.1 hypothetical protein FA10DRAFT_263418 [Acaromyces ingoldii]
MTSIENFDRLLAGHLGAAPLMTQSQEPSSDGGHGETPLRTPSFTGSIASESVKGGGEDRALKLQQLYRALADLYTDTEHIGTQPEARETDSASASPPHGSFSASVPDSASASPPRGSFSASVLGTAFASSSSASSLWEMQRSGPPSDTIEEEPRMLDLDDVYFTKTMLPERQQDDGRNVLARHFPQLTEAPARMFGEDGSPLPPTKKEETTAEEREARKRALVLRYRGKKMHSLIKSMVVMESRSINWKRVGDDENNFGVATLPALPDVWALDIVHQDLDNLQKTKAKRVFELADSRCGGQCPACRGTKTAACATCKGTPADECWWCNGSGKQKGSKCRRCLGKGKLDCQACSGTLRSPCQPCKGQGTGLYAAFVQVRVRRVDFPPLPTSSLTQSRDPNAIRLAATKRTKELIERLTEASNAKSKNHHAPLTASCAWETSASHLVEVEVPLAAKLRKRKSLVSLSRKSSSASLSSSAAGQSNASEELVSSGLLGRKIVTSLRYFLLPSDPDLQPAELARSDFERALASSSPKLEQEAPQQDAYLSPPTSPSASGSMTPVLGAFRPYVSPLTQMALTPDGSRPASRFHSPIHSPAKPSTPDIVERDSYFGSHVKRASHARSVSAGRFPIFNHHLSASQASTPRA